MVLIELEHSLRLSVYHIFEEERLLNEASQVLENLVNPVLTQQERLLELLTREVFQVLGIPSLESTLRERITLDPLYPTSNHVL